MTVLREPLAIKTFAFSKLEESPCSRQAVTSGTQFTLIDSPPEAPSPNPFMHLIGSSSGLLTEQDSPTQMETLVASPLQEMERVHTKAMRCSWDKHKKQLTMLRKKGY